MEKYISLSVLHLGCGLAPGAQRSAVTMHLSSGAQLSVYVQTFLLIKLKHTLLGCVKNIRANSHE